MGRANRWAIAAGLVVVAGGIVLALWPISGNGVSGNAIRPHYSDFGWFAYSPLPTHRSPTDLRRAGITVPYDLVAGRRRNAALAAALGVTVVAAGLPFRRWLQRGFGWRPRGSRRPGPTG